jgi:hypothetical protein
MTVGELISVLSEMDPSDVVMIGCCTTAVSNFTPAADSVYKAIVDIDGEPHNCVVIDMEDLNPA